MENTFSFLTKKQEIFVSAGASWPWLLRFLKSGTAALLLTFLLAARAPAEPSPGYTIHFNFIKSEQAARETVDMAASASAGVVSLVPPAHIWNDPSSLRALDAAIAETKKMGLRIIFSRLDAEQTNGEAWLYAHPLKESARLPDGTNTSDWFCATVGNHAFERWQHDETLFYAKRYGQLPNLSAMAVGGMVEPFVSQRGSLLEWSKATHSYEIAQYTPQGLKEWHRWLKNRFKTVGGVNQAYRTRFNEICQVPMPSNGKDRRFGASREAYFDLVQCLNDWFKKQYRDNQRIWRHYSSAPFMLQLSGFAAEKIAMGRPEFAALDLPSWVDMADSVGMSLYTNSDYDDWGHSSDMSMLQMIASASEAGKPTVIMESGCEAPHVTLNSHELHFALRMGLLVNPDYYVYEYFRYSRDGRVDPGMMVDPNGEIHQPGFDEVSRMLGSIASFGRTSSIPCFVYLSAPLTARRSELAGQVNRAVYQLAGYVPCRLLPWRRFSAAPTGAVLLLPPGFNRVASPSAIRSFLDCAKQKSWCVVSDKATCAALSRFAPLVSLYPLPLARLVSQIPVEQKALALQEELSTLTQFRQQLARQPLEPRPGLSWLNFGNQVYAWVEDTDSVTTHTETLQEAGIDRLWVSTRSGEPAELSLAGDLEQESKSSIPCRHRTELSALAGN